MPRSTEGNVQEEVSNRFAAVTPSDTDQIEARALFIGGSGDIALEDVEGNSTTFSVTAGSLLPVSPNKVLATGTTATGIVALK